MRTQKKKKKSPRGHEDANARVVSRVAADKRLTNESSKQRQETDVDPGAQIANVDDSQVA